MNTSKLTSSPTVLSGQVRPPVGQLAKTPLFLLKTSKDEALQVGRQAKQNPHTSERAQGTHAGDFMEQTSFENFDLKAMAHLNHLFTSIFPNTKVIFHNLLYVEQIQEGFLPQESAIFLSFVKIFAQFRNTDRQEPIENVILSNDKDFYLAFKLMKKRKLSDYSDIKPKNKNKLLDLIKQKFQNRTFTPKIIAQELFYNYAFIHRILALLILEREIEFVKTFNNEKFFRLREKPLIHVVESLDTQFNQ